MVGRPCGPTDAPDGRCAAPGIHAATGRHVCDLPDGAPLFGGPGDDNGQRRRRAELPPTGALRGGTHRFDLGNLCPDQRSGLRTGRPDLLAREHRVRRLPECQPVVHRATTGGRPVRIPVPTALRRGSDEQPEPSDHRLIQVAS